MGGGCLGRKSLINKVHRNVGAFEKMMFEVFERVSSNLFEGLEDFIFDMRR